MTPSKPKEKDRSVGGSVFASNAGISNYLVLDDLPLEALEPSETKILANIFCSECGGPLLVGGAPGAEPFYPTQ